MILLPRIPSLAWFERLKMRRAQLGQTSAGVSHAWDGVVASLRRHPAICVVTAVGFLALYHLAFVVMLLLKFKTLPNYLYMHPFFSNVQLILQGTPSWHDALDLVLQEPWIEYGYSNPDYYGLAEWSYMVMPSRLLLLLGSSLLLGIAAAQSVMTRSLCPLRSAQQRVTARSPRLPFGTRLYPLLGAGLGSALIGLGGATLTWVVCCATPSWIVVLSMLGMDTALSLQLEPLGNPFICAGIGLQLLMVWWLGRRLAQAQHSIVHDLATRQSSTLTAGEQP